jgi:hypothetical protein
MIVTLVEVGGEQRSYAISRAHSCLLCLADFSATHNSPKIDHLVVTNASAAAGGRQFNHMLDADIYAACHSAGGAAGVALEQTQCSWIGSAGTASGSGKACRPGRQPRAPARAGRAPSRPTATAFISAPGRAPPGPLFEVMSLLVHGATSGQALAARRY